MTNSGSIAVVQFVLNELGSNCYLFSDSSGAAVAVDPGGEPDAVIAHIEKAGLKLKLILATHGHADHVQGNAALRRATGAPIGIHPADAPWLGNPLLNGAMYLGWNYEPHEADFHLSETEPVTVGSMVFRTVHTPGHTPGSCCLVLDGDGIVAGGDLVFAGSVGRTDLPGGNWQQMVESLRVFAKFDKSLRVLPGHGPETTVGEEVESNPFIHEALAGVAGA